MLNLALVFLFDAEIGTTYLARAELMALGQLLARGAFFAAEC